MKIKKILYSAGTSGFFFDDLRAIKQGLSHDGFIYNGAPVTPGFDSVRQAGESVSIILELEDGQFAIGDAVAVQYSGAGGRDPLFLAETYIPFLEQHVTPILQNLDIGSFREAAKSLDELRVNGKRLHTALRYGLSQAVLDAKAKSENRLMCEVLCDEYSLPVIAQGVPIFGQTGDDRYDGADKMILKQTEVLPHALINNVDEKLGRKGEKLEEYLSWLVNRIVKIRTNESYHPTLHLDLYGTLGLIFDQPTRIAEYLAALGKRAGEFPLYIEGPVDMDSKNQQIDTLTQITQHLRKLGSPVKIVADEWCNNYNDIVDFADAACCHMIQIKTPDLGSLHNAVEAVLYCKNNGIEPYLGGSCNETDISVRASIHAALAAQAQRILARPGLGFDVGFTIARNEMARAIQIIKMRRG